MSVVERTSVVSRPQFFGRRTAAVKKPAAAAAANPIAAVDRVSPAAEVSSRPEERAAAAATQIADTVAIGGQSGFTLYWSFLKACAVGFGTALMLTSLFAGGASDPLSGLFNFNFLVAAVAAPSISAAMLWPAVFVWRLVGSVGFERGIQDLVAGGIIGALWLVLPLFAGSLPGLFEASFFLGGIAGGFAFWRAQGYPGVTSGEAAALDGLTKPLR